MRRLALTLALLAAGCSYDTSKYTLLGGDGAVADVPTGTDIPVAPDVPVASDIPVVTDTPVVTDVPATDASPMDGGMDAATDAMPDAEPVTDAELDVLTAADTSTDVSAVDTSTDVVLLDAGMDVPPVDTGVDVLAVDTGVDVPVVDTGVDVPPVDTGVDVPIDMSCATGMAFCGGTCISTTSDRSNCGACGNVCPVRPNTAEPTCIASSCSYVCAAGFADCNGIATDGCETNLNSSTNCGACGRACTTAETCQNSACYSSGYSQSVLSGGIPWLDACSAVGHISVLPSSDDGSAEVPLPFAFRYYGNNLLPGIPITVDTNGWMQLLAGTPDAGSSGQFYYGQLAQPMSLSPVDQVTPNSIVAPWWVDLVTGTAGICVATFGTAPNRQWAVEWSGATYFENRAAVLNFEVVLTETTNYIQFLYLNISPPPTSPTYIYSVTVGLGNATGTEGFAICNEDGTTCPIMSGMGENFLPTS